MRRDWWARLKRKHTFPSLVPLREHDNVRFLAHSRSGTPRPNGIACPQCSKELWDSSPLETLTSDPPQKRIHCPHCKYRGERIA